MSDSRFEKERGDAYSLAKKLEQDGKPEDHDVIIRLLNVIEPLLPEPVGSITPEILDKGKKVLEDFSQRPAVDYITESELETLKKRVPLDEGQASSL